MYFRSPNLQRRIISRNDGKTGARKDRSVALSMPPPSFLLPLLLCISFTLHKFATEIGTSLSRSRFSYRTHAVVTSLYRKKKKNRAITGLANFSSSPSPSTNPEVNATTFSRNSERWLIVSRDIKFLRKNYDVERRNDRRLASDNVRNMYTNKGTKRNSIKLYALIGDCLEQLRISSWAFICEYIYFRNPFTIQLCTAEKICSRLQFVRFLDRSSDCVSLPSFCHSWAYNLSSLFPFIILLSFNIPSFPIQYSSSFASSFGNFVVRLYKYRMCIFPPLYAVFYRINLLDLVFF